MRHYIFYILVCFIINVGCNTSTQKVDETDHVSEDLNNISAKDIESLRFTDYALSAESNKALENWQKYQELNEQIGFIETADFSFFINEKEVMKAFINDFKTQMPETIKTAPIDSRMTALETKLLKLNSILRLDNVDKTTRLKTIKEFLVAMSNLNLQINKKFELDANLVGKPEIQSEENP